MNLTKQHVPLISTIFLLVFVIYYNYTRVESVYYVYVDRKLVNFTGIEDFIPPYINIVSDYFIAPKYKLSACGIRKSMSQLTINTMCLLHDTEKSMKQNSSMNATWIDSRACAYNDEDFRNLSANLTEDPDLTRIAFIRDPFDRFLSFFLDKCVHEGNCWNCHEDMLCVLERLHKTLGRFKVHPDYSPTYEELHAAPLSWNCDFDTLLPKYHLLMMGADTDQRRSSILHLGNIMKSKGVPMHVVRKVMDESLNGETVHGTHKSEKRVKAEQEIKTNPKIRDYLHKIYFYDYLIFPFDKSVLDEKYRTDFWSLT